MRGRQLNLRPSHHVLFATGSTPRDDPFRTEPLCNPGPGRMLGVLVCERPAPQPGGKGEQVVLRAFSGQVRPSLMPNVLSHNLLHSS